MKLWAEATSRKQSVPLYRSVAPESTGRPISKYFLPKKITFILQKLTLQNGDDLWANPILAGAHTGKDSQRKLKEKVSPYLSLEHSYCISHDASSYLTLLQKTLTIRLGLCLNAGGLKSHLA